MSLPDTVERIAERFHETYEDLAVLYGYETRKESAVPWAAVPMENKALMLAVVRQLITEQTIAAGAVTCERVASGGSGSGATK